MEIAILSDTHIPNQAEQLPDQFRNHIEDADHVIHAGDFGSKDALEDIRELASDLTTVYGNADPNDIDLPAVASTEVGGVTFVVTHGNVNHVERAVYSSAGTVYRGDWMDAIADTARARADAEEPIVGVGGHTHEVMDKTYDGIRVLNPGSATGVGPADGTATMMTVEVTDGDTTVHIHDA
jgi:putative phosphoesterase